MNADQMREALWRHYAGRCAVLFEVSTEFQVEEIPVSGEPPIRLRRRRQIDVLTVTRARKAGIGPLDLLAIEIKVSRGDFFTDVREPAKQARWREVAQRHAYAVPEGLVRPDEVPADSGLLTVTPGTSGSYRYDVNWSVRARYPERAPQIPAWLTLGLAYRMSAAEAKLRGFAFETRDAGESAEDMRAALAKARADMELLRKERDRAVNAATEWKTAFAAAGGSLPCAHCRQPVKPRTLRGGHFSTWRHASSEHDGPCDRIRASVSRWAEIGPADDLDSPLEAS
jgi:hypothetical protein